MPPATPSWRDLMDEDPDKSASEPKKHNSEEIGAHRDGVIILATDPSRSHLRYALPMPNNVEDFNKLDAAPNLGPFPDALQWFQPLALKWMQFLPGVSRIAFGAELLWHVDNQENGYSLLDKLLPDVTVNPSSKEFSYRINRPRDLKVGTDTLTVNRLSKWGVNRYAFEQIQSSIRTALSAFYAVHAELDISTAADRKEAFPQERLTKLFTALVELAVEIAAQGDVP